MSANITYRIPIRSNKSINANMKSSFIEAMHKSFGDAPWLLGPKNLERLRGLKAAMSEDEAFDKIIEVIEKFDSIEVTYSY